MDNDLMSYNVTTEPEHRIREWWFKTRWNLFNTYLGIRRASRITVGPFNSLMEKIRSLKYVPL